MERDEKGLPVNDEATPSLAQNKKFRRWLIWLVVLAVIAVTIFYFFDKKSKKEDIEPQNVQIYANYTFPNGVSQISVPLIAVNHRLSREAGGWVITPAGSAYRIDYKSPIDVEYVDGRKFHREPDKPAWDGIKYSNGIFRLYGTVGDTAIVSIQRNVY